MRYLLLSILIITTLWFAWAVGANVRYTKSEFLNDINVRTLLSSGDSGTTGRICYNGDTLLHFDNTVVYMTDGSELDNKEVGSVNQTMFITVKDNIPIDTCSIVDMHNGVWLEGDSINILLGVDTISFKVESLPQKINLLQCFSEGKNWIEYNWKDSFRLSEHSRICEFFFQVYLPSKASSWTRCVINTLMMNGLMAMFLDDRGDEHILNEYYGGNKNPVHSIFFHPVSDSPIEIAQYHARTFERLYRDDFYSGQENDEWGPKYDYLFKMNPVWQSLDGNYITYRVYSYCYTGGAHGYMEEYYLTFDVHTGHILGTADIIKAEKVESVINNLEKKTQRAHHSSAYLADLPQIRSDSMVVTKEYIDGKFYPRPALTEHGMVFSYQPYEIGSFSEGIIHFVIPYSEISNILNINL